MTINDNNYEQWLVRYADGELTASERASVEQWLAGHPEAAELLALYAEAPRLEADESVHYTGAVPGATRPLWPVALRWSAAAAVLAAVLLPLVLRRGESAMPTEEFAEVKPLPTPTAIEMEPAAESTATMPTAIVAPSVAARSVASVEAEPEVYAMVQEPEAETPATTEPAAVEPLPPAVTYVDNLIAYEEEEQPAYDEGLIAYDEGGEREPGLRDLFLAANDASQPYLERTYVGHLIGTIIKSNK